MKQIFKKILIEIDKLPILDKKSLLKINTYQLEVLSKINKKQEVITSDLLKSQTRSLRPSGLGGQASSARRSMSDPASTDMAHRAHGEKTRKQYERTGWSEATPGPSILAERAFLRHTASRTTL